MHTYPALLDRWALILGASSGFGEAAALRLARAGMNIAGVHLDRRSTLENVHRITAEIERLGRKSLFFNVNAADEANRQEVVRRLQEQLGSSDPERPPVHILLHSLAFGTLKPLIAEDRKNFLSPAQISMTLDVMASSLVYWTQDLVLQHLLGPGSRIFAMTSSGSNRVIPNYGAVGAAKAALEAYVRYLACELAPRQIAVNAIRAGVTDTPALRRIPNSERLLAGALERNPNGRLTCPGDVAEALVVLSLPGSGWMTGNVLGVDGGEEVAA